MSENKNNVPPKNVGPKKKKKFDFLFFFLIILVVIALFNIISMISTPETKQYTYKEYYSLLQNDEDNITFVNGTATPAGGENDGIFNITGELKEGDKVFRYVVIVTTGQLEKIQDLNNSPVVVQPIVESFWLSFILSFVPYIILFGLFFWLMRAQTKSSGGAFDFAKSRARLTREKTVGFKDVAGCDEEKEELEEVIDFLKNPRKYAEIGARIPKGILLFGPPGTGKTLLAKATAGEANVPFFSISGSDFVEMFVGVGASRVRDMFKVAKENSPCIIFIDEIDAVGRQRGAGMGGGHDEREQTLNQLLVEMDGFTSNLGIIVMAATNRPDVLDPALLRPGRFDRQITINNPDVAGREAILKVHARNKHFEDNVNFKEIAQRTPGFSGADIENLLNEAALLAARQNRRVINVFDIDEAIDRVMMGPAKKTRKITEKERQIVAFHEAGHAVIGLKLEDASVVQKVTIVPRGQAGGYNLMIPAEERYLESKASLLAKITGYLGGRVAEEIKFKDVTTGAHNDFERATQIARAMVTEYGMSNLGPVQYEQQKGSVFLGRDYLKDKNFSDQIALEIDKETRRIIEDCYAKAKKIILDNFDLLTNIANYLLKVETLTKSDIDEIYSTGHLKRADEPVVVETPKEDKVNINDVEVLEENKPQLPPEDLKVKEDVQKEETKTTTEDKPTQEEADNNENR